MGGAGGQARDAEFAEFFAARGPVLRRTAFVVVQDWHLAEDVAQRALVKLYNAWPRISSGGRDAYARRVVVNESLSLLRRRRPELLTGSPPEAAPTEAEAEPPLDLVRALGLLTPQQRAVIALRFLDDLPVRETAEIMRIAEGTVRAHTARAIETLRRHLPELIATVNEETP